MKTKQTLMLTLLLLGVLLGREAQAFYNPATGRWLSRDPIVEAPFSVLTRSEIVLGRLDFGYAPFGASEPEHVSTPQNLYEFVQNAPLELTDFLGLMTEPGFRDWQKCSGVQKWSKKVVGARVPDADGCSVPSAAAPQGGTKDDPIGKCSFKDACNKHDYCYSDCWRTRNDCDERWGRNMKKACDSCAAAMIADYRVVKQFRRDCYAWANRYLWAVEQFGESAYENRQKMNCACVCP